MHSDLTQYWNPLSVSESEEKFRNLLALEGESTDSKKWLRVEILAWIARAESLQSRVSEAETTLRSAETAIDETCPPATRIRWWIESARLLILRRTPARARQFLAEAYRVAGKTNDDALMIEVLSLLALSELPKTQHLWIREAIGVAEKSESDRAKRCLGDLQFELGRTLQERSNHPDAMEQFKRSAADYALRGEWVQHLRSRWAMGRGTRLVGRFDEALKIQKILIADLEERNRRDGRVFEEIAECLSSLDKKLEAQPFFAQAYRELSSDEWINDNFSLNLSRLKKLGKVK